MTNKQRIKQLEKQKTRLLDNKYVSIVPAEYWTRSLDALASVLSVTRAELEKELQKLNPCTHAQG
jgi:biotin operon repressor